MKKVTDKKRIAFIKYIAVIVGIIAGIVTIIGINLKDIFHVINKNNIEQSNDSISGHKDVPKEKTIDTHKILYLTGSVVESNTMNSIDSVEIIVNNSFVGYCKNGFFSIKTKLEKENQTLLVQYKKRGYSDVIYTNAISQKNDTIYLSNQKILLSHVD